MDAWMAFLVETLHNLLLAVHHEVVVDEERRWCQVNAQHVRLGAKEAIANPPLLRSSPLLRPARAR
jgi:hypothetical protein